MNDRLLDALTLVSFMIQMANFNENLGQSDFQETIHNVVVEIHEHLEKQDRKIDMILKRLNKEV